RAVRVDVVFVVVGVVRAFLAVLLARDVVRVVLLLVPLLGLVDEDIIAHDQIAAVQPIGAIVAVGVARALVQRRLTVNRRDDDLLRCGVAVEADDVPLKLVVILRAGVGGHAGQIVVLL